jgi:hypothetical protein
MSEPPAPGAFFPFVYDELRRLAAARLAGKAKGYSLRQDCQSALDLPDLARPTASGSKPGRGRLPPSTRPVTPSKFNPRQPDSQPKTRLLQGQYFTVLTFSS